MLTINKYFDEYKYIINFHKDTKNFHITAQCLVKTWQQGYDILKKHYPKDTEIEFACGGKKRLLLNKEIKEGENIYATINDSLYRIDNIDSFNESRLNFYSKSVSKFLINTKYIDGTIFRNVIFSTWREEDSDAIYFKTHGFQNKKDFIAYLQRELNDELIKKYVDKIISDISFNITKEEIKNSKKYLDFGIIYYSDKNKYNYDPEFVNFIGNIFLHC